MLFLIEYDRKLGEVVVLREFQDSEQQPAAKARIELELDLNRRGIEHEVVLLQASSLEALKRTHGRYFMGIEELIRSA